MSELHLTLKPLIDVAYNDASTKEDLQLALLSIENILLKLPDSQEPDGFSALLLEEIRRLVDQGYLSPSVLP